MANTFIPQNFYCQLNFLLIMPSDIIRVSFMKDYPFVNSNCSKIPHFRIGYSCPMPGMAVEIIALITNYLNLTVEVAKVGPHVDGWINTFEEVYNNETDVYAMFFGENTPAYKEKYDFTSEIYSQKPIYGNKKSPCSLETWSSMIVIFVLFTAFGLIVRYVEYRLMLRKKYNFGQFLWKMFRIQLIQSDGIDYNLIAGRISFLIFSIFQICIILGLFQGLILSSVVKKVDPAPFVGNDFPRLVKEKKLTIVGSMNGNWIRSEIATSYESPFYELREATQINPFKLVDDVMGTVDKGNGAITLYNEHSWYKDWADVYCDLILVDGLIRPRPERFMFKKGNRFAPMFNKAISVNKFLIKRIVEKYFNYPPASTCVMQRGPVALSMAPYYGLLIPFSAGMLSACFVFSGELLNFTIFRKNYVI